MAQRYKLVGLDRIALEVSKR